MACLHFDLVAEQAFSLFRSPIKRGPMANIRSGMLPMLAMGLLFSTAFGYGGSTAHGFQPSAADLPFSESMNSENEVSVAGADWAGCPSSDSNNNYLYKHRGIYKNMFK